MKDTYRINSQIQINRQPSSLPTLCVLFAVKDFYRLKIGPVYNGHTGFNFESKHEIVGYKS